MARRLESSRKRNQGNRYSHHHGGGWCHVAAQCFKVRSSLRCHDLALNHVKEQALKLRVR